MKVSVLLPVYNGEKYLKRAIDSVLNQTFKDYELIIINDGSTDRTRNILLEYADLPNVRVFHKENEGVTKTLNMAFSLSQAEYITFLSHDDWWLPNKLENEVHTLESCLIKIGVVYSNFYRYYESIGKIESIFVKPVNQEEIYQKCPINISSAILRRKHLSLLEKRDGYIFDPTLLDCIDWDLCIRLSQICKFKHIPKFLTYYSIHSKQMSAGFKHAIIRWKFHLKWNGFNLKFFLNYVVRASLRIMLGRR